MCVPRKWFLGNCWSQHHQTWHGNCLRHDDASRVNYIDLDLHSWSQMLMINKCSVIAETKRREITLTVTVLLSLHRIASLFLAVKFLWRWLWKRSYCLTVSVFCLCWLTWYLTLAVDWALKTSYLCWLSSFQIEQVCYEALTSHLWNIHGRHSFLRCWCFNFPFCLSTLLVSR